jgi:CRP/FNR family cyclic AMP-dependent transcriptional regulator
VARDKHLEHIAAVPLFSRCNKAQLQEIAKVADELTLSSGTTLTRQGEVGRELFIIIEGTATVSRDGQHVATVGRGHFIGELAVLSHKPRTATVTAETDLDVLVLTSIGFSQLLDDVPGLAKEVLYEVVGRLTMAPDDQTS